jgi:hypothetical protein
MAEHLSSRGIPSHLPLTHRDFLRKQSAIRSDSSEIRQALEFPSNT